MKTWEHDRILRKSEGEVGKKGERVDWHSQGTRRIALTQADRIECERPFEFINDSGRKRWLCWCKAAAGMANGWVSTCLCHNFDALCVGYRVDTWLCIVRTENIMIVWLILSFKSRAASSIDFKLDNEGHLTKDKPIEQQRVDSTSGLVDLLEYKQSSVEMEWTKKGKGPRTSVRWQSIFTCWKRL